MLASGTKKTNPREALEALERPLLASRSHSLKMRPALTSSPFGPSPKTAQANIKQFTVLWFQTASNPPKDSRGSVDQLAPFLHCPDVEPTQKVSDERPMNPRLLHARNAHFWHPTSLNARPSHAAHEEHR